MNLKEFKQMVLETLNAKGLFLNETEKAADLIIGAYLIGYDAGERSAQMGGR